MLILTVLFFATHVYCQTKTIHVTPSNAKIYVDGSEVSNGSYTIKFKRSEDFVMLKFEAPGYITKEVKLLKSNPNKTIAYKLWEDEAEKSSIGGEMGDFANKWFDINVKQSMSEDDAWKRLMSITTKYFDRLEVRDKSAGWIKSEWVIQKFSYQSVRTNMEIKIQFGDENEIKYRVRLSSEIADADCGTNSQCFVKYNRILKKYEAVIEELQRSVGSNN